MGIEFKVAAKAEAAKISKDEDVVEVPIEDVIYIARRPTSAQVGLLTYAQAKGENYYVAAFDMVESMMGVEAVQHLRRLIGERRIDFDDIVGGTEQNPKGLISAVIAEFAGRPTEPSTASTGSRPSGGRRSTGRTPGKGSTSSPTASTGS